MVLSKSLLMLLNINHCRNNIKIYTNVLQVQILFFHILFVFLIVFVVLIIVFNRSRNVLYKK